MRGRSCCAGKDLRHQRLVLNRALGCIGLSLLVRTRCSNQADSSALAGTIVGFWRSVAWIYSELRKGYDSQDATLRAAILGQFPKINSALPPPVTHRRSATRVGRHDRHPDLRSQSGRDRERSRDAAKAVDEFAARVFTARADIATAAEDIDATNKQLAAGAEASTAWSASLRTYESALQRGDLDILSLIQRPHHADPEADRTGETPTAVGDELDPAGNRVGPILEMPASAARPTTAPTTMRRTAAMKILTYAIAFLVVAAFAAGGGYYFGPSQSRGRARPQPKRGVHAAGERTEPVVPVVVAPLKIGEITETATCYGSVVAEAGEVPSSPCR